MNVKDKGRELALDRSLDGSESKKSRCRRGACGNQVGGNSDCFYFVKEVGNRVIS